MMTMKVCTGPPFSFCTAAADAAAAAAALRTTTMTMTIAAGGDANATSCWMRLCDDLPRGGGTRAFLFFTLCCEFGMVDADVVRPLRQHDGCHGQQVVSPAFGMRTTLHNERRERDERMRKNNKFKFASVRRPFPPISPHPSFLPANFANSHVCIAADRRSTIIHHQLARHRHSPPSTIHYPSP